MSTPAPEPQHFAYLDAVRGMAFLGVLSVHCAIYCGDFPGSNIAQQGGYGVQLFFLASAITLCYSMASRKEANWIGLVHFYVRRIFRIVPLFWVAILVYRGVPGVVTQMWMSGWAPHGLHPSYFVLTALFLHGWNPNNFNSIVPGGWSIAVEMTFYVIFPLCFFYITNLRRAALCLLGGLLFSKVEFSLFYRLRFHLWPDMNEKILEFFLSNWFPSQLAIFLIGIFAYFLLRNAEMRRLYRDRFWASALLVFCVLALLSLWNGGLSGFVPFDLLVALALAGVIVSLAGNAVPLVVNPFICHVGQLSYSCYLTHFIAIGLALEILHYCFGPHLLNLGSGPMVLEGGSAAMNFGLFVLLVMIALMLTILFSIVTHHLIERPGIALGKWIIRRIDEERGVTAVKERVR